MLKKHLNLIFIIFAAFVLYGCQDPDVVPSDQGEGEYIVLNGNTQYKIVIPDDASTMVKFAANELSDFVYAATGTKIPIVSDYGLTFSQKDKYLSIGETTLIELPDIELDKTVLKTSGFVIKTYGNSVFMVGSYDYGTLYAVYDLLNHLIDFEVYSDDEIYYKNTLKIKLPVLDELVTPSFDLRCAGIGKLVYNQTYANRMRIQQWTNVWMTDYGWFDTVFGLLPKETYYAAHPDWYNQKGDDLCYSNEEMWETLVERVKLIMTKNPDKLYLGIHQNDMASWCSCSRCKEIIDKYQANSATALLCANYVAEKIREWLDETGQENREFFISIFSYQASQGAPISYDPVTGTYSPIEGLVADDNVGVLVAPLGTNYSYPYNSTNNIDVKLTFEGWSAICKNVYVWSYCTNFSYYLVAHQSFNTLAENYRYMADVGVKMVFDQGQFTNTFQGTGFYDLRCYLQSKLMWDAYADFDEIVGKYFNNYFKDAAVPMKKYFDEMRMLYAYNESVNGFNANVYGNLLKPNLWPKGSLDKWNEYCDESMDLIAKYQESDPVLYNKLFQRIQRERAMILYLLVEIYPEYYTSNGLLNLKMQFKEIATSNNFTLLAENTTIDQLWAKWNIS